MTFEAYTSLDATALAAHVRAGDTDPVELIRMARRAHDRISPTLNAVVEFYDDAETVPAAEDGPFTGIPFLRKDIGSSEKDRLQEQGSRLFEGYVADEDGYYIERVRAAGLRIVGRSNVPEFATSGFTETYLRGITRNPWNLERSAGGSSGGAASAVASGIVPLAQASDGGGSIRIPASWCGLVGLNPSRGRISGGPSQQDSLFGLAREFVLCRSVRDMAGALDALSGPAPGDPFIINQPIQPYVAELDETTPKSRIGVAVTSWGLAEMEPEVRAALEKTMDVLRDMGHELIEIDSPVDADLALHAVMGGFTLAFVQLQEAAEAMGRAVDAETVEPVSLQLYRKAVGGSASWAVSVLESMRELRHRVGLALADFDLVLTPTMPNAALPHGTYSTTRDDLSADEFMAGDVSVFQYLGVFNVTGQPSVTLPLWESAERLPIGMQIVAPFGREEALVRIARDLEEACPWAARRPPIHASTAPEAA